MEEEAKSLDWVNLPEGTATVSLWCSLHDGGLWSVASNLRERKAELAFKVDYLWEINDLPEDLIFRFHLGEVKSLRVVGYDMPGQMIIPAGTPKDEAEHMRTAFLATIREESLSWKTFEEGVAAGEPGNVEVSDATLAMGNGKDVALRLGLRESDRGFREITLCARSLKLSRSDGQPLTLEQFIAFGERYWNDFAAR